MAKTIKQYAEEYGRNRCKVGCDDFNECFACKESLKCREYYCKVETYAEIATEQRKRDIKLFGKWLEEHVMDYVSYDHLNGIDIDYSNITKGLCKAMEEEQ